jgi:acetolactate synthase-1/2/3 large subunit
MNVADYIIKFLEKKGVDTVFMVTGGQAMFLNDAVFRSSKIKPVFNHHEQASAMSAEAFGRVRGNVGVAMVTAGPGSVNALNGVLGAWADSSPMIVISGQSNLSNVSYMQNTKIRQIGLQGIYTQPLIVPITKYFVTIDDPAKVFQYLQQAFLSATSGRKGPVWLEVPLDIQRMEVPKNIAAKLNTTNSKDMNQKSKDVLSEKVIKDILELLYQSKRPLILAGQGIHLAGATVEFTKLVNKVNAPVVTTRLGIDLIESDNKLFIGRPGLYGDRPGNFTVQNADLIICIGARLDTGIVGYDPKDWGRHAKKVVIELDPEELEKPGINIDIKVKADAFDFLDLLNKEIEEKNLPDITSWVDYCNKLKKDYPMVLPEYKSSKLVNSYYFSEQLSKLADKNDLVLVDTSSVFHVTCQTWKIKKGQRFITTGGISTMGYWPAAIGACVASGRRTIVVTGDGSLQMNVQELATVKQNKLPIKIFVINNHGYLLIRHTQKTWLGGRMMGESPKTGLWCPDLDKLAAAYQIKYFEIASTKDVDKKIKLVLNFKGPVICSIESPTWQPIIPRVSSFRRKDGSFESRPYEDLFPFLPKDEIESNNFINSETGKDK